MNSNFHGGRGAEEGGVLQQETMGGRFAQKRGNVFKVIVHKICSVACGFVAGAAAETLTSLLGLRRARPKVSEGLDFAKFPCFENWNVSNVFREWLM